MLVANHYIFPRNPKVHDILPNAMKSVNQRNPGARAYILFLIAMVLCFIVLSLSQNWMLNTVRKEKMAQHYAMLNLTKTTTDLSLDQAFKLSQLLLLDNDIAKFVYQGKVEGGSSEIQAIIDAKSRLPVATSVNAILSEIYLYSRKSGYLLSSANAFLDPELMYPTMFAFEGLNYRQFKSSFLDAAFSWQFFPQTEALVQGRKTQVIPLVQTFPLNNPAANNGKIVMLLDSHYFGTLLEEQSIGTNPITYITDSKGQLITYWGDENLIQYGSFEDGQQRITIDGQPYILSIVTSEVSSLRFFSLLSLKDINAMMNPLWVVLVAVSLGMFLLIGSLALFMLLKNRRHWNELLSMVDDGGRPLPYEQAIGYIQSIVSLDRNKVRQAGGTPFITDTFFRRLIHGKMLGTGEIQAMLKLVQQDMDLSSPFSYQMVHIMIHEVSDFLSSERLEDIDFTRIAAQKQATRAFGSQCYLYMDFSFSIWIMLWHLDERYLDHQIDWFWKEFTQVAPCSASMAVSSPKQSLEEIFAATNECSEVQQSMGSEKGREGLKRYAELSLRREPYHYTNDMERKLYGAVLRGEKDALLDILRTIEEDNFKLRCLGTEETANLLRVLYTTAIKLNQGMRLPMHQSVFFSFEEAKSYFLALALTISRAKSDKEEVLTQKIVSYIEEHYQESALNLSIMANDFGMKESFLYHFIQTRMETSFAQYLEAFRMEKASFLFAQKQMTIAEVTVLCGYSNPQTFRRAFQKHFGMLPSDYQKTVLYRQG